MHSTGTCQMYSTPNFVICFPDLNNMEQYQTFFFPDLKKRTAMIFLHSPVCVGNSNNFDCWQ